MAHRNTTNSLALSTTHRDDFEATSLVIDGARNWLRIPQVQPASVPQMIAFSLEVAEHHVSVAEASVAHMEETCRKADAAIAALRALAVVVGIDLPPRLPATPPSQARNLTREEFAEEMRVSVRRIDQHRKKMTIGVHYHRDGTRVLFHHPEAADFLRSALVPALQSCLDTEQLAMNEVARRRAITSKKKGPCQ